MKFTKLIPNVFYENIEDGLTLFLDCLEFNIGYSDLDSSNPYCIVEKDELAVFLFQNKEYAGKDRPEMRLHTDDIDAVYAKMKATHPEFLSPDLSEPTLHPWGAREFALRDATGFCIIIQQWD